MFFQSRFGWLGRKVGMTNMEHNGKVCAVTLVEIFKQHVLSTLNKDGYISLKVGVQTKNIKKNRQKKPQVIEMEKLNKPVCDFVKEFKVGVLEVENLEDSYGIDLLGNEKFVDVCCKSIGKGFAGGMKRWNFQGAGASHGTSLTHRAIGSTGTREKNWPNKKMPGRMGHHQVTVQNLSVLELDKDLNLVVLNGCVPGKSGSLVILRKAIKKQGVQ